MKLFEEITNVLCFLNFLLFRRLRMSLMIYLLEVLGEFVAGVVMYMFTSKVTIKLSFGNQKSIII